MVKINFMKNHYANFFPDFQFNSVDKIGRSVLISPNSLNTWFQLVSNGGEYVSMSGTLSRQNEIPFTKSYECNRFYDGHSNVKITFTAKGD